MIVSEHQNRIEEKELEKLVIVLFAKVKIPISHLEAVGTAKIVKTAGTPASPLLPHPAEYPTEFADIDSEETKISICCETSTKGSSTPGPQPTGRTLKPVNASYFTFRQVSLVLFPSFPPDP